MKFKQRYLTTKSGKKILIRLPNISEAQQLLDLKLSYIKGSVSIPMYPDEYLDLEGEKELISNYEQSKNGILLVAEWNGELIGNIDLTGGTRRKMFHTGMIGMGNKSEWRNQGVGGHLLKSVLDWAKESSELKTIWLEVYATNEPGIALYEKMGFIKCGEIPEFFKENGGYVSKITMYQNL